MTTTTKRALCIGINYPGTNSELRGCINDALLWKEFFSEKGYEVTLLVDEPEHGTPIPTRENILAEMKKLAESTQDNDYIVLTYSGHGSHIRDQSGDETDHRDETICPCDYASNGMIVDDEIKTTLLDPLPESAHFLGLMDCCHSGTSLDFQYNITDSSRGAYRGAYPNAYRNAYRGAYRGAYRNAYPYRGAYPHGVYATQRNENGTYKLGAYGHRIYPGYREYTPTVHRQYRKNVVYRGPVRNATRAIPNYSYRWIYFPFFGWFYLPYFNSVQSSEPVEQTSEQPAEQTSEQPAEQSSEQYDIKCTDAVMFSGCSDSQTSADAYLDGKSIGAFTYCMYESFKNQTNDINTHYRGVNNLLSSHRFEQRSNVSMSRKDIKELHLF
jgi:hypothetical protein